LTLRNQQLSGKIVSRDQSGGGHQEKRGAHCVAAGVGRIAGSQCGGGGDDGEGHRAEREASSRETGHSYGGTARLTSAVGEQSAICWLHAVVEGGWAADNKNCEQKTCHHGDVDSGNLGADVNDSSVNPVG